MGRVTLTLLCLWSCLMMVTPLGIEDLQRASTFFEKNIFQGFYNAQKQFAYFVRFTDNECNTGLQEKDLTTMLNEINVKDAFDKVNDNKIYEGKRMVAAAPISIRKRFIHAESRLLNLNNDAPVDKRSPIDKLLDTETPAGCAIFFSFNSPCVKTCTDPNGPYNIINKLKNVQKLPANRAFTFKDVWGDDLQGKVKDKEGVWESWKALDAVIPLFRCTDNKCYKCFNNVREDKCYDAPI